MSFKLEGKQHILILLATFLIVIMLSNSVQAVDLTSNVKRVFKFDDKSGVMLTDYSGTENANKMDGLLLNQTGILNRSVYADGTGDGVCGYDDSALVFQNLTTDRTISWCMKALTINDNDRVYFEKTGSITTDIYINTDLKIGYLTVGYHEDLNYALGTGHWVCFDVVFEMSNQARLYVNGTSVENTSLASSFAFDNNHDSCIGIYCTNNCSTTAPNTGFDADFDEFIFYERALTSEEVKAKFNNITANCSYPYNCSGGGPPPPNYFTITSEDYYTFDTINNFSARVNGTWYNTTNGIINTNILENASVYVDVNISSNSNGGYLNRSWYRNVSNDLTAFIYQSRITLQGIEATTFNPVNNFTVNSTPQGWKGDLTTNDSDVIIYYKAGNYTLTITEEGNYSYHNFTQSITVNPKDEKTINLTFYETLLNITVHNAYTGQNLSNFTGWAYNINNSYNETFNSTYKNETIAQIKLIKGNYTIYVEHPNYAISKNTNYQNISLTEINHTLSFGLYSNNSIRITIRNEATNLLITDNISITITGNASENTYYTTTGSYYKDNLIDGNYTIKFSGTNYTTKTYTITVADRSTQTLNAYLSQDYETVTFTVRNSLSGSTIEGASFIMARLINSTWTTVESKQTDITGRVQVNYLPDIKYKFTITATNYTSKIFYLDPVIFDSYDVTIDPVLATALTHDYVEISIVYYPKTFYSNQTNTFIFIIGSPKGALSNYSFNLSYPGGAQNRSGNNAIGEEFNLNFNITGANWWDTLNLTFSYDTTTAPKKTFKFSYEIIGADYNNQTYISLKDTDYGLGILEKILLATITVIVLAGFTFLVAGIGGSLFIGIITYGFFVYIEFLPLWSVLITVLAGFILIVSSNRGY